MARKGKRSTGKTVETLRYRREEATRKNIPTAEYRGRTTCRLRPPRQCWPTWPAPIPRRAFS